MINQQLVQVLQQYLMMAQRGEITAASVCATGGPNKSRFGQAVWPEDGAQIEPLTLEVALMDAQLRGISLAVRQQQQQKGVVPVKAMPPGLKVS